MIEIIKNSNLPPLAPNQIPRAEPIAIIIPTMKYGDVKNAPLPLKISDYTEM